MTTLVEDRFIVAEVSKNWLNGQPFRPDTPTVSQGFGQAINLNYERGYRLHSFTLHRLMIDKEQMNETIIAVFERREE